MIDAKKEKHGNVDTFFSFLLCIVPLQIKFYTGIFKSIIPYRNYIKDYYTALIIRNVGLINERDKRDKTNLNYHSIISYIVTNNHIWGGEGRKTKENI